MTVLKKIKLSILLFSFIISLMLFFLSDLYSAIAVLIMGFFMFIDFIAIEYSAKIDLVIEKRGVFTVMFFFLKLPLFLVIIYFLNRILGIKPIYLFIGISILPISILLSCAVGYKE